MFYSCAVVHVRASVVCVNKSVIKYYSPVLVVSEISL